MSRERAQLAAARYQKGWSQEQAAERIGVTRRTLSQWERGMTDPHPFHVHRLCEVYGKSAVELDLERSSNEKTRRRTNVPERSNIETTNQSKGSSLSSGMDDHEGPARFPQAVSRGIIATAQELGEGLDMEKIRRQLLQFALGVPGMAFCAPTYMFDDPDTLERLSRVLRKRYSYIDNATLTKLQAITQNMRYRFVRSEGAFWRELLQEISGHLNIITLYLERPQPSSAYSTLCALAGETALLIGDILFNAGDNNTADIYYNEALEAAKESCNDGLRAVILVRKSFIPIYSAHSQTALPLLNEAQSLLTDNDIISAWLWAVKSEAYAKMQDANACYRALDRAKIFMARNLSRDVSSSFTKEVVAHAHMSESRLLGYKGTCLMTLNQPEAAQAVLKSYLATIASRDDPSSIHHKSITLTDLGKTYVQQMEIKEACDSASQAIACIVQTGSARVFQRVLNLRRDLHLWDHSSYVKNLDEQILSIAPSLIQ